VFNVKLQKCAAALFLGVAVLLPQASAARDVEPFHAAEVVPVVAAHGMVASQDRRATQIGVDILRRGGNAVDAAVAVALALAVTLPEAGNLGGGGFMLVHLTKPSRDIAIDYREAAPSNTPSNVFLGPNGDADPVKSRETGLGVGVPGTVAGLSYALEHYGSGKFNLADLAAPAITLAKDGFAVDEDLAASLAGAAPRLAHWPSSAKIFLHPDGSPLKRGERLVQSDLAQTLQSLADGGAEHFYKGPVAEKIAAAVRAAGGHMTAGDLAAYKPLERPPVRGSYRGYDIVSMPPPSSGGVALIELLNILEGYPLDKAKPFAPESLHLLAEAMKRVYADRAEYLGDPDRTKNPIAGLTNKDYAAKLRAEISPDKATPATEIKAGKPLPYESLQTTHFSIVDANGDAVSNTYTLNFAFGVGLVADGTGVMLNNELDDFAAKPGAPNAYGLTGGAANEPSGGKRPLSSMTPTLVFRNGALQLVTGSPGGSRIITIVADLLIDCLDFHMNVAQAEAAPRIHDQWLPDELQVESSLPADIVEQLAARGHKIHTFRSWGSAQSIERVGDHWEGATDPRQHDGLAAGY
jgi:gamma-glutamyltranspeptidase/glutathione hydrolase